MTNEPVRAFVDSNVWLYALIEEKQPDARHAAADALIDQIERPFISAQVMREILVNLLKKAGATEAELRHLVAAMYADCQVVETDREQLLVASRLRESHSLSYWDSLIVAAALAAGCETLFSEDLQHGQLIDGRLRIVNPFASA